MPTSPRHLLTLLLLVLFQGQLVAASAGFYYRVQSADTLDRIAARHRLSKQTLARENNLKPTAKLKAGTRLWIPAAATKSAEPRVTPRATPTPKPPLAKPKQAAAPRTAEVPGGGLKPGPSADLGDAISRPKSSPASMPPKAVVPVGRLPEPSRSGFIWPVEGRLTRRFKDTASEKYTGVDIATPFGTEVRAARDGTVVYVGDGIPGYGKLVIVEHASGFATLYGHNSQLLVSQKQKVRMGQVIARSGSTGRGSEPYLHFEVRRNRTAVDPVTVLP